VETPILGVCVRTYYLLKHSLNLQQTTYMLGSANKNRSHVLLTDLYPQFMCSNVCTQYVKFKYSLKYMLSL